MIRWGILGCGKIAHKFAEDLSLSTTGYLFGCASRDEEKACAFATKYNASSYFKDYESIVRCKEIDVMYIATPHSHHFEHTMLCLKAGKAVLCEKPMTINTQYAKKLFEMANIHKVLLVEAMWTIFLPAIQSIKSNINMGIIGKVCHISADFGFKSDFDPQSRLYDINLAGGALLDIGIYPLFMSLFLLGVPTKIHASGHMTSTNVDDQCTIMLEYADGATAALYCAITHKTDIKCEIFGTDGKILIPSRFHEQSYYILETEKDTKKIEIGKTGYGYYHEIEHINACLRTHLTVSPFMTPEMTIHLIQMMDRIRKTIGLVYPWDVAE